MPNMGGRRSLLVSEMAFLIDIGGAGRTQRAPAPNPLGSRYSQPPSGTLTNTQSAPKPLGSRYSQPPPGAGITPAAIDSAIINYGGGNYGAGTPVRPSATGTTPVQRPTTGVTPEPIIPGGLPPNPPSGPIAPSGATPPGGFQGGVRPQGSGGGGQQAPQGQQPVIPGINSGEDLRNLTESEIEAVLNFIGSQYGLTREQLTAQQGQLGLAAQSLAARADQLRREGLRGAQNQASERGILRSGIHARNVAGVETDIARQVGDATQGFQAQGGAIDTALARLQEQELSEKAAAESNIRSGLLQFEQGQNLANLMASLPPMPSVPPMPAMPAPPILTAPQIGPMPGPANIYGGAPLINYGTQQGSQTTTQQTLEEYLRRLTALGGSGSAGAYAV